MKFLFVTALLQFALVWKLCESIDCNVPPKSTESRLHQHLLCGYDKEMRPVVDSKNNLTVKIKFVLKAFSFEDEDGKLTVNSWLSMKWTDEHLKWNRKDYDNMDSVTVHGENLWLPDFSNYNSGKTQHSEACTVAHCLVSYNGEVSCIPPCEHEAFCKPDYTYWPFDTQNCSLYLGSWIHKGEEIDYKLQRLTVDSPTYMNRHWSLIDISAKKNRGNYSCCPGETYPSLQYTFVIERQSASERAFVLAPALILASLNLITLWLNPNSSERIIMCIVSVFSHFLYLQHLAWLVPKNGATVPNALLYFRDSLVISAVLILQTLIMRGLLTCRLSVPDWIKSTTESVKSNKVGQLMFSNPYLINSTPLNEDNITDDSSNLIESGAAPSVEEPAVTAEKVDEKKLWATSVKIFDTLLFVMLVIIYIFMLIGWIPSSDRYTKKLNADILEDD